LKPGDTLLLYSDGLIETRSRGGEEFGLAAVRSVLSSAACTEPSARKITEKVLEAFDRHARGVRDDDLTLVVVSR
jgi:serine phosphatase RsbU (regulator of sigma subunit)